MGLWSLGRQFESARGYFSSLSFLDEPSFSKKVRSDSARGFFIFFFELSFVNNIGDVQDPFYQLAGFLGVRFLPFQPFYLNHELSRQRQVFLI